MHVLNKLNLSQALSPLVFRPQHATMRHYQSGVEYLRMPLGDCAEEKYGAPYYHIHRADLHQVLYQAAMSRGIEITLDAQVAGYRHLKQSKHPQVQLDLQDGRQINGDALIGADGIRSRVKANMLGESNLEFSGHVAWRSTIKASKLPPGLIKPNASLWVGPGGHVVSYFVRGGAEINLVAVQERHQWTDERWSVPGDVQQLRSAFAGWHPEVQGLLNALDNCFLWGLFTSPPLNTWVDGQVALLGDACHPMLPFLAQGAAMAIEDGYSLACALATQAPIHQALLSYQTTRVERVSQIQSMAAKNADLYHMKSLICQAKLMGLRALNFASPGLASTPMRFIYEYNNTLD